MAIELARWQIRVNAINPVAGDTPLLATFMGGEDTPEARARILTTIPLRRLTTPADTYIVPALIADLGEAANWRYVEFFTANINNDHTRRAYARVCSRFFAWCENRGLSLTAIRPFDVAAWVKDLQGVAPQFEAFRLR